MTDDQLSQLSGQIADLGKRVDTRLGELGTRMDTVEDAFSDQFAKLYQHMEERFDKLEAQLATKADGDRVYRTLDGIAGRLDTDEQERAAVNRQLSRHERWHEQTATKLGMKLDYEAD